MIAARVQPGPFDVGAELALLDALGGGAVASFTGIVRGGDGLEALTLEHHPRLTEPAIRALVEQAASRWSLLGATVIHRIGRLTVGSPIVLVATAAAHRAAALESCAFLIDRLKTTAPFWKCEHYAKGEARWVEARAADEAAAARWEA